MTTETNGDLKLILHRIASLEGEIKNLRISVDGMTKQLEDRLRTVEVKQAVGLKTLSDNTERFDCEISELRADAKRENIIGTIIGAVGAWIAAVLTYLGITHGGSP